VTYVRKDWSAVDAKILAVLRCAERPLKSREISKRGKIPRLHFDIRLQVLKQQGRIACEGRTIAGRWRAL
jgi:hypothetical protein